MATDLPEEVKDRAYRALPMVNSLGMLMFAHLRQKLRAVDKHTGEVLVGSAVALGVKGLAAVAMFGMTLVVTRHLGAGQAGLFFLGYTIALMASAGACLGLENTFVRFVAINHEAGNWGRIYSLYKVGMLWSLLAALCISTLLLVFSDFIATVAFGKPEFTDTLRVIALTVPLTTLFILHAKVLQGLKRVAQSLTVLSVSAPLITVALVLLATPAYAVDVAWLYLVATASSLGFGMVWWLRAAKRGHRPDSVNRKEILSSCIPLFWVVVLGQIIAWFPQLLVGVWGTSADVAVYNAAQRTAMLISFALLAVNTIAAPKFAALHRSNNNDTLKRTAIQATRITAGFALVPLCLMLALPETILSLFGSEFDSGANVLRILAIGQFVNAATGSVGFLLSMSGKEAILRNNVFISALVTLGLGLVLVPAFGIVGAAIATATGVSLQNLLHVVQVQRILGFNTLAVLLKPFRD